MTFDLGGKRVYVAGHTGLLGRALVRALADEGCELLTATRAELDLTRQAEVEAWMETFMKAGGAQAEGEVRGRGGAAREGAEGAPDEGRLFPVGPISSPSQDVRASLPASSPQRASSQVQPLG